MTLFKKIYIHPLTIVLAIIVTLTGMYKDFLIIFLIIIIHIQLVTVQKYEAPSIITLLQGSNCFVMKFILIKIE